MYYFAAFFLKIGLRFIALFSSRIRRLLAGQRGTFARVRQFADQRNLNRPCLWFHCASLGEFEQGRPLMEAWQERYPEVHIVLTFFSPSGYNVRHNYAGADLVCYLPLDGWHNARRFVALVRPTAAFFVKYEYWYGYLDTLHRHRIPAYSVSTILAPNTIPFRWYGGFYRRMMRWMTHYFVQDQTTIKLLRSIDIDQATLAGDTRFDRAAALCREAPGVALAAQFKNQELVWVIGSSWPPDTDILLPLIQKFAGEIKFIVAPHEIEESELARIEEAVPYSTVRYSQAKLNTVADHRVLLIDNIGMLTSLYQYGSFAYVGGAFGKSLHNVLEPATFGMPIYFGNRRYQHVREARALEELGGAFSVGDSQALRRQFLVHLRDEAARQRAADITRQYVANHTGATDNIIQYVETQLGWKES